MLGIFTLGFRHGFDVDHVAAITDISGSQFVRLRAFLLSTLYALGHAMTVVVLGLGISWAGWDVPDAGRLVGATLVLLGAYVLWCSVTGRRPSSRGGLVLRVTRAARDRIRPTTSVEHDHPHDHGAGSGRGHGHRHDPSVLAPDLPVMGGESGARTEVAHRHRHRHEDIPAPYGIGGALAVGAIHGIGAETPTQVLALAAGTASLVPFLAGLFLANSVMAAVAALGLTDRRLRALNAVVGAFSVYVGVGYLLGLDAPLLW